MASNDQKVVSYGQFGGPSYRRIDKQWLFQRNVEYSSTLEPISESQIVRQPENTNDGHADSRSNDNPSTRRKKQIQTLIQAHPELQPAGDLLPELARVSEAVENAAAHFDPNKSQLLAFGTILDEGTKRSAVVAAFPVGSSGEDLCLAVCHNVDTGWEDSRSTFLAVPTPSGERSIWSGPGVPIQQIVFASPQERQQGNFLAVRLMTKTLVFRPSLKRTSSFPQSLPDANLVVEIPIDDAGGSPHAHITFNPWYTRQIGIIDQAGRWSVWEMTGRNFRSVERMYCGELSQGSRHGHISRDSWARLLWITNRTTLVLADRYAVHTLELSSKVNADEAMIGDGSGLLKSPILDMATFPDRPAHFAVLTSTHVTVYHLDDDAIDHPAKKSLLCLQHRLDPLDTSLSIRCFANDADFFLMIYSATTDAILVFPLQFVSDEHITASDPFALNLNHGSRLGFKGLHVEQVHIAGRLNTTQGLAATYAAKQMSFFSITALAKDLSITRSLYVAEHIRGRDKIRPLAWERKNAASSSEVSTRTEYVADASSDVGADMHQAQGSRQRPMSAFLQRLREGRKAIGEHDRTLPAVFVASELDFVSDEHATDFGEIIEEAVAIMQNNEQHTPLQTLRELLQGEVTLGDAESAVRDMERIRQLERDMQARDIDDELMDSNTPAHLVLRDINLHHDAGGDAAVKDTAAIYRELSRGHYTGPLTVLSDLMQSSREGHFLRLAAEVSLASQVLRHEHPSAEGQSDSQPQAQSQRQSKDQDLGLQSSQLSPVPSTGRSFHDSFGLSSQLTSNLPTPSPTATPSLMTTSSNPSTLGSLELTSLSKFATFSKPMTSNIGSRLQCSVVNEWIPGADPSSYDWQTVSRRLLNHASTTDPTNHDETEMTDRELRSLQRKAERYVRRQRREAEQSQRLNAQRNLLPRIQSVGGSATASQPDQVRLPLRTPAGQQAGIRATQQDGHPQSSQSVGPGVSSSLSLLQGPPIASQILPGRHGGRPPARKKRKSGF